jgi:Ala-tRNA(Pro) deacylase
MSLVTEQLQRRGAEFIAIPHAKTFTSLEEAEAIGVHADEVLKTVVLDTAHGHALAVIPGDRRLDMRLVEDAIGDPHAHLANEDEMRSDFPDIELGAFPPMGSVVGAPMFVDPEVLDHETVLFAAGKETESVRMRTDDLFRGEVVTVAPLTQEDAV